jgi:prepilin-type N-terminal cleavage/methylation domain-containing protein
MFYKSGMRWRNQGGFTLVEILVALAILGVILPVAGMSIFQVLSINTLTGNHLTVVKQVENAVYRINRDAQMAQTVQTSNGSSFPLKLIWVQWDSTSNNVTYTLQNGVLSRVCSINGSQPTSAVVAQNINPDSAMTNLDFASGVLTFKITASIGGFRPASETRVGKVIPKAQ